MIRSAFVLAVLVLLGARAAHAEDAHAFVEIAASKDTVFANEPVRLVLRVRLDRDFFADHAVPLFRRSMDVPVQATAPWLAELTGAVRVETAGESGDRRRLSLALGDRVVEAVEVDDEVRDGRTFQVLELSVTWLVEEPGEIELEAPTLRYAFAAFFEEDFLGDRIAIDRQDGLVRGAAKTLRVAAWPEAGRPVEFVDAVGRFEVDAVAARKDGEETPWQLTLVIRGEGNLATLTAPAAERIEGFHVYGAIDDAVGSKRTITYDLAPLDEAVKGIPAIAFAFLDPGPPARYRVVLTSPILLGRPDVDTASEVYGVGEPFDFTSWKLKLLGFAVAVFGVLATVVWLGMRRNHAASDPEETTRDHVRDAAINLRRAAEDGAPDLEARLKEYLAARLDTSPAAVITPDLAARLKAAGLERDVADRTAAILEDLVAARYGGASPASAPPLDAAFADMLTSAWK